MIRDFLSSWDLFQNTYLAGWLSALLLALIGVLVVARDQIFLGAAVAQASTVGIALALALAGWVSADSLAALHSEVFPSFMAVLFSVAAAILTARGGRVGEESREAVTGWVFLLSSSVAVLMVSHSPHGLEEIHRVVFSSIIGATPEDVWVFGVFAALATLTVGFLHKRLLLFAMDPAMAQAVGMRTSLWALFTSACLGLAMGLSLRVSGLLYTFGCLVLPALIAKNLSREVRPMFVAAPAIAVATATAGFVLAHRYDYPPAQMTVALLSGLLALVWGLRTARRREAGSQKSGDT